MKQSLQNYWTKLKAVAPYLVVIWSVALVTIVTLRATKAEVIANADMYYWAFLGTLVSLIAVPILYKFKK